MCTFGYILNALFLKLTEGLTVDTSNAEDRIAYILTGHAISDLTPNAWYQIVQHQLHRLGPYIEDLPAMTDHTLAVRTVNEICGGLIVDETYAPLEVTYPQQSPDLGPSTRLLPLVALSSWSYQDRSVSLPWVDNRLTDTALLISSDMHWVKLERVVERTDLDLSMPHPRELHWTTSLSYVLLAESELIEEVGDRPYRWHRVLRSLDEHLARAISEKSKLIADMKEVHADFASIAARIEKPRMA